MDSRRIGYEKKDLMENNLDSDDNDASYHSLSSSSVSLQEKHQQKATSAAAECGVSFSQNTRSEPAMRFLKFENIFQ